MGLQDGDRVAIVTISTETEPLEPVVEAAEEEPVPTHGDVSRGQRTLERITIFSQ